MSGPSEMLLFLGRFHPLLVHLPLGLILLLATLELLARSRRFPMANANGGLILALTVPLAGLTALCGWLLSLGGGYENHLLQWHQWTGIGTAAVCALAGLFYLLKLKRAYRWVLFASVGVLVVASHFGGSLTHGSDYLVQYAPAPFRRLVRLERKPAQAPATGLLNPLQRPAFAGVVQPLFEQKCVSCHGPEKSKGGLRLDSLAGVLKGGENGPAVVAGKPAESQAWKRMRLASDHDDHMPPEGKPQPTPDELAFFEWWLKAGAPAEKRVAELNPPANVVRWLTGADAQPPSTLSGPPPKLLADILPAALQLADSLSIPINPLTESEGWLQANAAIAGTNFDDAGLSKLAPLGPNLRWLDLAGTRISDAGLASLRAWPNLTRLHLERTTLTDAGLAWLTNLTQLEYLNLYGTAVSDAGLTQLEKLPKLKHLYLWQTRVSPEAAKQFQLARTDREQLRAWEQEIELLQARIRANQFILEIGVTSAPPAVTSAPVNKACPVSGEPAKAGKTVVYEGRVIAFCCDDCKAKFQQDPKPFLAKLPLKENPPPPQEGK